MPEKTHIPAGLRTVNAARSLCFSEEIIMKIMKINPADNVAVALTDIAAGETAETGGASVTAKVPIPRGHKIALTDIAKGQDIVKYGFPIAAAKRDISAIRN